MRSLRSESGSDSASFAPTARRAGRVRAGAVHKGAQHKRTEFCIGVARREADALEQAAVLDALDEHTDRLADEPRVHRAKHALLDPLLDHLSDMISRGSGVHFVDLAR